MKKVLLILSLSGLLSILLVPVTASVVQAASCPRDCNTIPAAYNNCNCGTAVLPAAGSLVCGTNGANEKSKCTVAAVSTGGGAPTLLSDVESLKNLVNRIGDWVFIVLMSVAGTFLIVAGLMWVTAGGNPEKLTKARQMLINSLIGLAIGLLARGVVMVIDSIIRG